MVLKDINMDTDRFLVIDVGGSAIKFALMDASTVILEKDEVPTPLTGLEDYLQTLEDIYRRYEGQVRGIAMSAPGAIDSDSGYFYTGGYLQDFIHDINLQVKQIVADQRTVVVTADSVKAKRRDHIYSYSDAWVDFRLNTADSILTYKARDSLQTIIARQFKHKFLFWKWGTKGYQVKVINFNPHSTISYNNYIQVTE